MATGVEELLQWPLLSSDHGGRGRR